ncbi:MAG: hypothetical protein KCHDKBKB_00672 [Elusimicrobia bacterium]|nr:hypothetical protein [Elusimicrobiota bacterium]
MIYWQEQAPVLELTKEMLDNAKPHSVLWQGQGFIEHPWFNQAKDFIADDHRSVMVKIVIFRGGIADWCIYHSLDANLELADNLDGDMHLQASYERVLSSGGKVRNEKVIRSLVKCSDEVMELYRY